MQEYNEFVADMVPAIGMALDPPGSDAVAYIVAIENAPGNTFTLIGGPAPMTRDRLKITAARADGYISELSENIAAPMLWRARHVPPIGEVAAYQLWEDAKAAKAETYRRNLASAEAAQRAAEAARAEIAKHQPEWAKAAIVASLEHDDCDSMTDYFHVSTSRRVIIGWSRHTRDLFPEMRKAAALFPETAHLVDAPGSAEHREKWSMGGGYYLKAGSRYCDGWKVSKESIGKYFGGADYEIHNSAKAAPIPATPTGETDTGSNAAGLFTIERHTHTKKGWDMWICTMAERVERADFDRFLAAAKALGGWYSRPWAGTPGGFAFKCADKARQFVGGES